MEAVPLLILILSQVATSDGVTCHLCFDAVTPSGCNNTAMCGGSEVCFTRQFTDHFGKNRFHMGCEHDKCPCVVQIPRTTMNDCENGHYLVREAVSDAEFQFICTLLKAATVIGKREDDSVDCFECCSSDVCNSKLCLSAVI